MNREQIIDHVGKIRDFNISHTELIHAENTILDAYRSIEQHRLNNNGKIAASYKPSCIVVSGPPGSGKTQLCQTVHKKYQSYEDEQEGFQKTITPSIFVSISSMSSPKSVTSALVKQFHQDVYKYANEQQMLNQVSALFNTGKTNLVLLDEVHDIVPGAGVKKVVVWLKSLVNTFRTPVVISGIEDVESIVDSNPELSKRFKWRIRLKNMGYSLSSPTKSDFARYMTTILNKVEKELAFKQVFSPNNKEIAQLYLCTDGNLDSISSLVIEAAKIALLNKDEHLHADHFAKVFDNPHFYLPRRYQGDKNPLSLESRELEKNLKMIGVS